MCNTVYIDLYIIIGTQLCISFPAELNSPLVGERCAYRSRHRGEQPWQQPRIERAPSRLAPESSKYRAQGRRRLDALQARLDHIEWHRGHGGADSREHTTRTQHTSRTLWLLPPLREAPLRMFMREPPDGRIGTEGGDRRTCATPEAYQSLAAHNLPNHL